MEAEREQHVELVIMINEDNSPDKSLGGSSVSKDEERKEIGNIFNTNKKESNCVSMNQNITSSVKKERKKRQSKTKIPPQAVFEVPVELPPEIMFWKNKLQGFYSDLKKRLSEGLNVVKPIINQEYIKEKVDSIEKETDKEKKEAVLEEILAPIIDMKPAANLTDIVNESKSYISTLTSHFDDWTAEKLEEFILRIAERNNYLKNVKHNFKPEEINNEVYYVWELRKPEYLVSYGNMADFNLAKKRRIHKQKVLDLLWKLIQTIEKTNKIEDVEKKINPLFDKYSSIQNEVPVQINKKGKKRNLDEANANGGELEKTSVEKNMKKLKIDSDIEQKVEEANDVMDEEVTEKAENPSTAKKKRSNKKASTAQKPEGETENPEANNESVSKNAKKQKKEQLSPIQEAAQAEAVPEKKKSDQRTLFNFFTKKSEKVPGEKSVTKALEQISNPEKKSVFKCIGSLQPKSFQLVQDQQENDSKAKQRLEALENVIANMKFPPLSELEIFEELKIFKAECKYQRNISKKRRAIDGKRKLFLHFAESSTSKPSFYIFNKSSQIINGRRPFEKDEIQIDYEIDSDEELEEKNATSIGSKSIGEGMEEEDEISSEDEKFIVPDNYLSDEEVSDKEENHLNITGYDPMMSRNPNKPFLFSLLDYSKGSDANMDEYLNNFQIIKIVDEEMPVPVRKLKIEADPATLKVVSALADPNIFKAFLKKIHGSYDNKINISNEFTKEYPSCSKYAIDRKIKELQAEEKLKKEKGQGDSRLRYVVSKALFEELQIAEDYDSLLEAKFEENRKEQENKKAKAKKEIIVPNLLNEKEPTTPNIQPASVPAEVLEVLKPLEKKVDAPVQSKIIIKKLL